MWYKISEIWYIQSLCKPWLNENRTRSYLKSYPVTNIKHSVERLMFRNCGRCDHMCKSINQYKEFTNFPTLGKWRLPVLENEGCNFYKEIHWIDFIGDCYDFFLDQRVIGQVRRQSFISIIQWKSGKTIIGWEVFFKFYTGNKTVNKVEQCCNPIIFSKER